MDGTSKNDTQPIKTTTFNGWPASLVPGTAETVTASWAYGPWGTAGQRQKTHLLLPSSETEEMLHANESTVTINRPGNPLRRYDTNFIPGNKRTEDAHAVDILSKDDLEYLVTEQAPGIVRSFWERWSDVKISGGRSQVQNEVANGSKDMVMASVFDGHNDTHVLSDLLSKTVHASLAHSLGKQGQGQESIKDDATRVEAIKSRMTETYKAIEADLDAVVKLLTNGNMKTGSNPLLPDPSPLLFGLSTFMKAGSTALTALLDVEHDDLYVANASDSRCIAGWFNPSTQKWRCDTLSNDQTGDNPSEEKRYRDLHPNDDPERLIFDRGYGKRGLGVVQTTRAFGNLNVRLSSEGWKSACDTFQMPVGNFTITDRDKSPPYMNSEPEVIHRKLHNDSGESLKFLILGVDGVFDRVTSEEATLLMAAYLEHKNHPPIAKTDLPSKLALTEPPTERPWPSEPLPGTVGRDIGKWVFANDENAATHMIRNSLPGNGDAEVHRIALSLRENTARQFRDDMTAVVLFFGDESSPLTSNEATTGGPV